MACDGQEDTVNYTDEQKQKIIALIDRNIFARRVEWRQCLHDDGRWEESQDYFIYRKTKPNFELAADLWKPWPCYFDGMVKTVDGVFEEWVACAEYPNDYAACAQMRKQIEEMKLEHRFSAYLQGILEDAKEDVRSHWCWVNSSPLQQCIAALIAAGVDVEKELAKEQ